MRRSELGGEIRKRTCLMSFDEGRPRGLIIRADETHLGDYGNPDDNSEAKRPHGDDYDNHDYILKEGRPS